MEMEPMDMIRDKFNQECEIATVHRLLTVHFDMTEEQAQAEIDEYFRIVDMIDRERAMEEKNAQE